MSISMFGGKSAKWFFVSLLIALFQSPELHAGVNRGRPAPALEVTQLLQAPPQSHADLKSLRGKLVVLEFWATWCAPCLEALPRYNALVDSVSTKPIQFISITDEDPDVVRKFLGKRRIAGWVAIDGKKSDFSRYRIEERPTTVVIGPSGQILAVTTPEALSAKALVTFLRDQTPQASGPQASFPKELMPSEADVNALLEVSLVPSKDGTKTQEMHWGEANVTFTGTNLKTLLAYAFSIPATRIRLPSSLPAKSYDLKVAGHASPAAMKDAVQKVFEDGLQIDVSHSQTSTRALVLTAASDINALIRPTASTRGILHDYEDGKMEMVNASADDLAATLEGVLKQPVVNKSSVDIRFDVDIPMAKTDLQSAADAIRRYSGFVLKEDEVAVDFLVIDVAKTGS